MNLNVPLFEQRIYVYCINVNHIFMDPKYRCSFPALNPVEWHTLWFMTTSCLDSLVSFVPFFWFKFCQVEILTHPGRLPDLWTQLDLPYAGLSLHPLEWSSGQGSSPT